MSPQGHCLSDSEFDPAGSCFLQIFIVLESETACQTINFPARTSDKITYENQ